jgi:hypothetical protein
MRYGVFSEYRGYPTDMRNAHNATVLCQISSSDYPADMRKLNVHNDLRRNRISATEARGVRAPQCPEESTEMVASDESGGLGDDR